jgi:hypothetical protein
MTTIATSVLPLLNQHLDNVAQLLDIPEDILEEATARYEDVATWLGQEDSPLAKYAPELYPQGSFRLGTPIRPLSGNDEFDIDLVCRLQIAKESTTQEDLKNSVGDRLKADKNLSKMIEERRRCWQLRYAGRFHLDVLPAIPDVEWPRDSILLTDTDLVRWQHSNPIGYANWFYDRMRTEVVQLRESLAKAASATVEDIPEWRVRTPLQRAVQLLKRHRNLRFAGDADNCPASIVITTLAARSYNHEADTFTALLRIVRAMPEHIENRDGRWWVPNPVHPEENFADKWNEKPARHEVFLRWLASVDADLNAMRQDNGARAADIATRRFGIGSGSLQALKPLSDVPALADSSHAATPPWPLSPTRSCSVRTWVYTARKNGKRLWQLRSKGVPKHVWLRFEASTSVPEPYGVFWQIVNTGPEAAARNQLRGDFNNEQRGSVRWETTAYAGTHWVEAFVVKDAVCVARSGRTLVKVWR